MTLLLVGAIIVPLLAIPILYSLARRLKDKTGFVSFALLLIPLITILYAALQGSGSNQGAYQELYSWSPIGNFGFRVDNLSLPILFIISLLTALVSLFSVPYMRQRIGDDPGRYGLYYSLYALYSLGMIGTVLATNLIEFYLFFEIILVPSAYAEAPTPISAILAAAMTGIGGYATVRIVITIFPQSFLTFSAFFAGRALITMIYGSAMALVQDDIKRLLAYSSISQMGYILFGLAAFNSFGVSGSMFQYVSNGTAKGILFIVVGAVMLQVRGERSLSKLGGLASKMPITATAAFIGSLTLAGLPSTNGFLSEFFLFQGGFVRATDTASEYRLVIAALGIIATVLTAGYSLMAMKKIFFGAPNSDTSEVKEAPWTITLPLITLSVVTIILGIYPEPILGRLLSAARAILGS